MRPTALLTAMLLASAIAWATQTQTPPPPASTQPASTQTQPPAASGTQAPANAQAPAPAVGNHRVLQAKSQDELKAYQDAITKTDPAQAEAAAKDFATKFATSDLRG